MSKVLSTSNYKQFKILRGNREISQHHVTKLVKAIAIRNLIEERPIMVNESLEVIDGQHRLLALEKLNLPVFYVVVEGSSLQDVLLLNAAQESWKLEDYVESYLSQGNKHYQVLKDFYTKWDLTISSSLMLLSMGSHQDKRTAAMKAGQFVPTSLEQAEEIMHKVKVFAPYISRLIYRSGAFLRSVATLVDSQTIDWERMAEKLEECPIKITYSPAKKDYFYQLERIYNYKNKTVTRLY